MHTITINIDDNYFEQVMDFLQHIPKSKREIFQHTKIDISSDKITKKKQDFLSILENGPTISEQEAEAWENDIKKGYTYSEYFERVKNLNILEI